jgi:ketosteroid isomerase-like protein
MIDKERIVREATEAFNSRDMARVTKYVHPELTVRRPLPDMGASQRSFVGSYRGPDELVEVLNEMIETLNGLQFEMRRVEEIGDNVLLYELLALIGPETERSAQLGWYVTYFRDGLILTTSAYATEAAAREAIERGTAQPTNPAD